LRIITSSKQEFLGISEWAYFRNTSFAGCTSNEAFKFKKCKYLTDLPKDKKNTKIIIKNRKDNK
jgi:hypothetical protein